MAKHLLNLFKEAGFQEPEDPYPLLQVKLLKNSHFTFQGGARIVLAYSANEDKMLAHLLHEFTHYELWRRKGWKKCHHTKEFWKLCDTWLTEYGLSQECM